ncbi:MAG: hypothetical protein H0Z35_05315 [Thermoanaerobacteraceae bacterium]|nr:hypothetical protein [Thermoanaerobacteraceae bacterium]
MLCLRDLVVKPGSWGLLRNALVAAMLVVFGLFSKNTLSPRTLAYKFVREMVKLQTEWKTRNWLEMSGEHFYVRYKPEDSSVAKMVLETAEQAFQPANRMLGMGPGEKVPVVIYPNKASFNKSFGWDADQNAMGVYWAGVIRVLSPNDWVKGDSYREKEKYFRDNGPMAHEYAHLIVDYKTGGNYPRWLTEGIAQYVEREVTGFQFRVPEITGPENLYSLSRMDKQFDFLPSQRVAYWQSLAMVEYMIELKGMNGIHRLLVQLGEGERFSPAFGDVYGMTLDEFQERFAATVVS